MPDFDIEKYIWLKIQESFQIPDHNQYNIPLKLALKAILGDLMVGGVNQTVKSSLGAVSGDFILAV